MDNHIKITDKVVLITGANRGIGRALVEEALRRGAKRVYAGTRVPFSHPDQRVTPLILDITKTEQIQQAVEKVEYLDILINNAGVSLFDNLTDRTKIELQLAGQPLRSLRDGSGIPSIAALLSWCNSQQPIVTISCSFTTRCVLFNFKSSSILTNAIVTCFFGSTGCTSTRGPYWPYQYRYEPWS
jgi:short-subunit dehydrogenase involved in D-alanine esterification of teichoic acids